MNKGTFRHFQDALEAYCKKFGRSYEEGMVDLILVLRFDRNVRHNGLELDARGDIIITCELCRDDAWWQANYNGVWQAAQWWHCGPFGLDCP